MTTADHLSDSDIAGYLDRDLEEGERERVEAHIADCGECRGALVAVEQLALSYSSLPGARAKERSRRRVWLALSAGLGVLAAAAAVAILPPGAIEQRQPPTRAGQTLSPDRRDAVVLVAPSDNRAVAGDDVAFVWNTSGVDHYRLTVFDESGKLIALRETPDTSVVVSLDSASGGKNGTGRYLWKVEGIADGVAAASEVRALTVSK